MNCEVEIKVVLAHALQGNAVQWKEGRGHIAVQKQPSVSVEQEGGLAPEPVCILWRKWQTLVSARIRKRFLCFKAVPQTRIKFLFTYLLTYLYKWINLKINSDFSFRGSG